MTRSAYLIVKRFESVYAAFAKQQKFDKETYAFPLFGTSHERLKVRYRGLDRDPLDAYDRDPALAAEIQMFEFEGTGRCAGSLIYGASDVNRVLAWAEEEQPGVYEPVWARLATDRTEPPTGYVSAGFEPSFFPEGHFSPICDCMCFPRWHGTDREGVAFATFFEVLNDRGLFDNPDTARLFLRHYLSFDWTERGEFSIVEVFNRTRFGAGL